MTREHALPELQIMRLGGPGGFTFQPLVLEAWIAAVDTTPGVRLAPEGAAVPNARTGEIVRLWRYDKDRADAEVQLADGVWKPVFRWHTSGWVALPLDFDATDAAAPETAALFALAEVLGASVVDGQGTRHPDPRPGSA